MLTTRRDVVTPLNASGFVVMGFAGRRSGGGRGVHDGHNIQYPPLPLDSHNIHPCHVAQPAAGPRLSETGEARTRARHSAVLRSHNCAVSSLWSGLQLPAHGRSSWCHHREDCCQADADAGHLMRILVTVSQLLHHNHRCTGSGAAANCGNTCPISSCQDI